MPADSALEERAAHEQAVKTTRGAVQARTFEEPAHVAHDIGGNSAARLEIVRNTGKQPVQDPPAAGQKTMRMPALRHAAPILAFGRKAVAFNERDRFVVVRQDAGSE